jgi:glycosyltransferase involved in cell wall biosynthesis
MRVLLVNKFYYLRGGAERSFFETKKLLEARWHRVIPFAMRDAQNQASPYERFFVDPIDFNSHHSLLERLRIVPRVIYFRQARDRIEQLLRREKVDVAHLHNIAHQISPSILDSLKKFGIPVVQTLHDYKLVCPTYTMLADGHICERCRGGRYYHAVLQRCNKGSFSASLLNTVEMYTHRALHLYRRGIQLFIAPSRFLRRKVLAAGTVAAPILYLPNCIEADRYVPQYGGDNSCVYFGRLSSEKGVDTLIRAMQGCPDLRLLIIGEGSQRKTLEELARKLRLENVEFLGSRYGPDLHQAVAGSLFTVLPSRCYENCPYAILESFAMGKPVLGTDIGGIPELISAGEDGFLFPPGNVDQLRMRMQQLAAEKDKTIEMGKKARQKVSDRFGRDAHYDRLTAAYERIMKLE